MTHRILSSAAIKKHVIGTYPLEGDLFSRHPTRRGFQRTTHRPSSFPTYSIYLSGLVLALKVEIGFSPSLHIK